MTRDLRDTATVRRAQRGDRAAYGLLVDRQLEPAYRVASALLGPGGADAVEDVFAAGWHELPRLTDPADFGPWLESILAGVCALHASRAAAVVGTGDGPASALEDAFDRLEPHDRVVLVLRDVAGRTDEEIARIVHEPVGLVRTRIAASEAAVLGPGRDTSSPDAGHDPVRESLLRRAAPPPPDLQNRIAARIARAPQTQARRSSAGLAAPLAIVLALAVFACGGFLVGRIWHPEAAPTVLPSLHTMAPTAQGSPSDAAPPDPSETYFEESAAPVVVPTAPPVLTIDRLAFVTPEGYNLRVRSEPGVSDAATRLQPLLPAGTRMLVLRGPTHADNHDWYQVQIESEPTFGWVASGGGGVTWLAPAAPQCSGAREPRELWTRSAIDLLACYGDEPFAVQVVGSVVRQASPCADVANRPGCKAEPRWLLEPMTLDVVGDTAGAVVSITVAVPDSVQEAIAAASPEHPLTILIALDRPAAQSCRVVDAAGLDVIARDAAVARCRLTFAVVAMAR